MLTIPRSIRSSAPSRKTEKRPPAKEIAGAAGWPGEKTEKQPHDAREIACAVGGFDKN
jgi:hypothetical protein